jgi:hypothetical protein
LHSVSTCTATFRCRRAPPKDWPSAAYTLIGRDDLAAAAIFAGTGPGGDGSFTSHDLRMRAVPGGYLGDEEGGDSGDGGGGGSGDSGGGASGGGGGNGGDSGGGVGGGAGGP